MLTPPNRNALLDDAIDWMVKQVERARAHAVADSAEVQITEKKKLPFFEATAISAKRARESAQSWLDRVTTPPQDDELAAIADKLGTLWGRTTAGKLARAWLLNEKNAPVQGFMKIEVGTIAVLIGMAAAAAVLAIVLFVRRGLKASVPNGVELLPSHDFQALRSIAEGQSDAAQIAARLRDSAPQPWTWTASEGIANLNPADTRKLLEAFAANSACGVTRILPNRGETFDAKRMEPQFKASDDDRWLVANEVPPGRCGFELGGRKVVRPSVDVCTVDWWVLSNPACPVGRVIADRADDLVAGGAAGSLGWRAPWGLAHPEDLRELFDEPTLDAWRKRMVSELNPHYRDRQERCLSLTGAPGDVFELSTMEPAGAVPVGDAVVEDVVERQGVRQFGLACPGGSPMLLALVRTTTLRRGGI
jgi:hypothetical protein